jgi:hypothetical protein
MNRDAHPPPQSVEPHLMRRRDDYASPEFAVSPVTAELRAPNNPQNQSAEHLDDKSVEHLDDKKTK